MRLTEDDRQFYIKNSVVGKMLNAISKQHNDVLVFGCGTDLLPRFLRGFYPHTRVTAYDIDAAKIAKAKQRAEISDGIDSLLVYTVQRPTKQFEVVLASHVLHHSPLELATEAVSFVKPGGLIGIADYDMKGCSYNDFFARWGKICDEENELEKIGLDEAHQLHTTFCLDNCKDLMHRIGVQHLDSQGKIASMSGTNLPTLNFYYVGIKPK